MMMMVAHSPAIVGHAREPLELWVVLLHTLFVRGHIKAALPSFLHHSAPNRQSADPSLS